ncbi:MAG: hypothetical protein Q4F95_02445 [Oscillospiraceae bacterium]|nr:hypothetical protein [Oscillospiraceae bacterium]
MKIRSFIRKIIILIAAVFLFINILWFFFVWLRYYSCYKDLGLDNSSPVSYINDDEKYTYSIIAPSYLDTDWHVSVDDTEIRDSSGKILNNKISRLTIWPEIGGKYKAEFFTRRFDGSTSGDQDQTAGATKCKFCLTRNRKLTKTSKQQRSIFEAEKTELDMLLDKVDNMWDIFS